MSESLPQPRTVREMVAMARGFLERKGVEEARLEAELLTAHALGLDRMGVFLRHDAPVSAEEVDRARDLFVRRGRREPVAYIVGSREFYGRDFEVGPGVLVPRPETEHIVDLARERLDVDAPEGGWRILDVGTGSGNLLVTLALQLPGASCVGVDVSAAALAFSRRNAERHGVEVTLVEGDGPRAAAGMAPFDLIVSNPPYIDPALRESLAPEVREFEPDLALFAPEGDPDCWVRRLLGEGGPLLRPGGCLLVELGADQGERVLGLAAEAGGVEAELHPDLAGHDRVLELRPLPGRVTG